MGSPGPGDVVADRYLIRRILGRGGMGVVYEASNLVTGKRLALKWLLPNTDRGAAHVHRLIREARASARVQHPNIVDIYDVSEHEGCPFLVMEYLEGVPLSTVLDGKPSDPGRLLAMLEPVLQGLSAVHRRGVVHRDLKPSNVFLCTDDGGHPTYAKLLDFGISKIGRPARREPRQGEAEAHEHDADSEVSITDTGVMLGTPQYMAPEQLDEARSVDQRTDVYAVGVMLYGALSGVLPFDADSYSTLVLRITSSVPTPLDALRPDLPPGLSTTVERAMARRMEDRFADVPSLLSALRPFAAEAPHRPQDQDWRAALAADAPRAPHPPAQRRRTVSLTLVGALLALSALSALLLSRRAAPMDRPKESSTQAAVAPALPPEGPKAAMADETVRPTPAPASDPPPSVPNPVAAPEQPAHRPAKQASIRRSAQRAQRNVATPAGGDGGAPYDPLKLTTDQF